MKDQIKKEKIQNKNRSKSEHIDAEKNKRSEPALSVGTLTMTTMIETSPIVMSITQLENGRILNVNRSFENLFSCKRDDILGESSTGFWPTAADRKKLLGALGDSGQCKDYECVFRHKEGHVVTVLISAHIVNVDGEQCVFSLGYDISERIEAEIQMQVNEEEKFSAAINASPDAIVVTRVSDGKIQEANEGSLKLTGYRREEVIGKTTVEMDFYNAEERKRFIELLQKEGKYVDKEFFLKRKDGKILNTLCSAVILNIQEELCIFAIIHDITHRKQAEWALAVSEAKFRMLYHDTPATFFNVSKNGKILSVNEYGADQLGYRVEELMGIAIETVVHQEDMETVKTKLKNCFSEPDKVHRWEIRHCCKDGLEIRVRETVRVVNNEDGLASLFIVCEDITETHRLSQKLSYQASHDSLTGLVNRSEFERRVEKVINANRLNPSHHALCYLDLDQFKIINDSGGHLAGDELLRQLSEILRLGIRKIDTFARLGGDEFGVLMEHCGLEQATQLANTLREKVEDFRFVWKDKKFSVGVSIGLVPIVASSGNVADILSAADAACYAAKDGGRNRIHVYSSDDTTVAKRRGEMQWVNRIKQAMEEDRLRLYYQKIVSINDPNKDEHYELLLRMSDENGKLVPPGAFLPAAERYGLSTKVDQWVVNKALSWLAQHPEKLEKLHICAINLSGQSLGNEEFMENLLISLNESGIPENKICFEITETSAIANLANAIRFIKKFRKEGCLFALDDFGSGLSSFGYLKNLPVDYIKIDGSFVRDIATDKIDRAMVKSITEIGQIMGKKTIAEFVGDDATLQVLKELGVDYVQGYGIAKPRAFYNVKK